MSNYDKEYAISFNVTFYKYDTETGEEVLNKDGSIASYKTNNKQILKGFEYMEQDLDVNDFTEVSL